uniref:Uncharacterized protein n=1 Tax=Rhizophora mucronata TaxID=61149 RepID=A0A2P2MY01_RHIMU
MGQRIRIGRLSSVEGPMFALIPKSLTDPRRIIAAMDD